MNDKKIHELIGRIKDKEREKVYTGKFAGTYYYLLNVVIENKEVSRVKDSAKRSGINNCKWRNKGRSKLTE